MTIEEAKLFLEGVVPAYLDEDTVEVDCCKNALKVAIASLEAWDDIVDTLDEWQKECHAEREYGKEWGLRDSMQMIRDKMKEIENDGKGFYRQRKTPPDSGDPYSGERSQEADRARYSVLREKVQRDQDWRKQKMTPQPHC